MSPPCRLIQSIQRRPPSRLPQEATRPEDHQRSAAAQTTRLHAGRPWRGANTPNHIHCIPFYRVGHAKRHHRLTWNLHEMALPSRPSDHRSVRRGGDHRFARRLLQGADASRGRQRCVKRHLI